MSKNSPGLDKELIFRKTREVLVDFLKLKPSGISMTSRLSDDLGVDSVDTLDIALALERKFKIDLGDYEIMRLVTVEDLVEILLEKCIAQRPIAFKDSK